MNPSVTYALTQAFNRVGHVLFKPFNISKWFVLGFCAWLASLGEGGMNLRFPRGRVSPGGGGQGFDAAIDWFRDHLELVIFLAVLAFLITLAIALVLAWLRARGRFMFLDGVARNRSAVVEPWRRFRHLANSLFWFSFLMGFVSLITFLFTLAVGVVIALPGLRALVEAWPNLDDLNWGRCLSLFIGVGVAGLLMIPLAILWAIFWQLLHDFIVPVMYLRNVRTLDAWRIFRREIAPGQFGNFVLFYLLKIALGLGIATAAVVVMCLTCCIAALPYIGTVILLPLSVFMRCYSLYFLQQFGQQWHVFEDEPIITPVPPYQPMPGSVG